MTTTYHTFKARSAGLTQRMIEFVPNSARQIILCATKTRNDDLRRQLADAGKPLVRVETLDTIRGIRP